MQSTYRQPAPDDEAPRLFVGQIPREMFEEQLRPIFEPYGELREIHPLKDAPTMMRRWRGLQRQSAGDRVE